MANTVRDVMTEGVITVAPNTPLKEVARLLVEHAISGLPVVDGNGSLLGVVSEADFLLKEQGADAVRHRPLARLLGESDETRRELDKVEAETAGGAMTSPALTIDADEPIRTAAETMVRRRVNRLPVTDGGRLVGIVSRADLVRAYVRSDQELTAAIRDDVLLRALWLDPDRFDVRVTDGVAHIAGTAERRSTAAMVERVVSMVPGIVGVEADIRWQVDDREFEAPGRDYVSPYEPPRTR